MLVSLEWLNEYCDLSDLSPDELAATFTSIGLEVEGIHRKEAPAAGVLIGRIDTAVRHPQADTLQVCSVDVGRGQPLSIVCGAANARAGLHVAVATLGTVLPGNFEIKKAKIRGVESEGMLCSEKELGLSDSHAGILELPSDLTLGEALATQMPCGDTVLELSITPNRGDCLSYLGLARDLAAKLGRPFKRPSVDELPASGLHSAGKVTVRVAPDVGCARFTALSIEGVKPVASPLWLRRRLEQSGMRPINLIVDVTNYAMLEQGQPVHAYDERFVDGRILEVRAAHLNDRLTTLDGKELALKPGDILICDGKKPVGLAGIMGGANSEVRDDTTAIIVEVAHFSADQVRRTSKRLALHTEASRRFERGIDLVNIAQVAKRVAQLLTQCAESCGLSQLRVACDLVDQYAKAPAPRRVALRLPRVKGLLALPFIGADACVKHLQALEFKLVDKTSERLLFEIPPWRHDVEREIDLIEEIARMVGYDEIPYELPRMEIYTLPEDPFYAFTDEVKVSLAQKGLCEVITFPFLGEADFRTLRINEAHPLWPSVFLANALNEEMSAMQTTLVPGLLKALLRNRHRGQKGAKIFEVGRAYRTEEALKAAEILQHFPYHQRALKQGRFISSKAREAKGRMVESLFLAGVLDAPYLAQDWQGPQQAPTFFHAKELTESLAASFGLRDLEWVALSRSELLEFPWLHPGASAVVKKGKDIIGWAGELHPKVSLDLGFGAECPILFELHMESFFAVSHQPASIKALAQPYPPVVRDFAFLVEASKPYGELEKAVSTFPGAKYLKTMRLFDLYQGEHLPSGKKSLAATFTFASSEKTLVEGDVEKEVAALLDWLRKKVGAELRA